MFNTVYFIPDSSVTTIGKNSSTYVFNDNHIGYFLIPWNNKEGNDDLIRHIEQYVTGGLKNVVDLTPEEHLKDYLS